MSNETLTFLYKIIKERWCNTFKSIFKEVYFFYLSFVALFMADNSFNAIPLLCFSMGRVQHGKMLPSLYRKLRIFTA